MPIVQATVSFVIELGKFHNVDLYRRGYYQIRVYLRTGGQSSPTSNTGQPRYAAVVEPPLLWEKTSSRCRVQESVKPSYIDPGATTPIVIPEKACSKTLLIMYRDESVRLGDVLEQRMLFQVDPCQLEESLANYEVYLCVELWFAEEAVSAANVIQALEKAHERQLRVHLSPTRGIHHHFDVFFDYFHLCAVEMAIHGALTSVSPNIVSISRQSPRTTPLHLSSSQLQLSQQSWHTILFSVRTHSDRKQLALTVHRHLCHALLAAREAMLLFWREILAYLPVHAKPRLETVDFVEKLDSLSQKLQTQVTDEDLANELSLDISQLSSQNTVLLRNLCKSCVLHTKVASHLRRKAHQIRMKRLAEAFFCQELSLVHLLAVYDPSVVGHETLACEVRQSAYFQQLPALPVSCRELDGDATSMPVIFEDVYLPPSVNDPKPASRRYQCGVLRPSESLSKPSPHTVGDSSGANGGDLPSELRPVTDASSEHIISTNSPRISNPGKTEPSKPPSSTPTPTSPLPLSRHSRHFWKSSPSLMEHDSPRFFINLPPVLRYIGQSNKRRFRRSSYHGRRSVHLLRTLDSAVIPGPVDHDSIKLLGFRKLTGPDCLDDVVFSPNLPTPRPQLSRRSTLASSEPSVQLRPKGLSLAARDFRTRSLCGPNANSNLDVSTGDFPNPSAFVASDMALPKHSHQPKSHNLPINHLDSVNTKHFSNDKDVHNSTIDVPTNLHEHRGKASTIASPGGRGAPHSSSIFRTQAARPTYDSRFSQNHTIALGTLSRPPPEPPGGCVPKTRLPNDPELIALSRALSRSHLNGCSRTLTLPSLSLPNQLHGYPLARVNSDSAVHSLTFNYYCKVLRPPTRQISRNSSKHSRLCLKRSNSALCQTYTPDLAYLGSCSDLTLSMLASSELRHQTVNSGSRLPHSVSLTGLSTHFPSFVDSSARSKFKTGSRNNIGHWIVPCWSLSSSRSGGAYSSNSDDSTEKQQNRTSLTTYSPKGQSAVVRTLQSAPASVQSYQDQITLPHQPEGNVHRADSKKSTIHDSANDHEDTLPSRDEHRLQECGYQLPCDEGDSDDDVYSHKKNRSEKMNIIELLKLEAGRLDRPGFSQQNGHVSDASEVNPERAIQSVSSRKLNRYTNTQSLPPTATPVISGMPPNGLIRSSKYLNASDKTTLNFQRSLLDIISPGVVNFLELKESVKRKISLDYQGHVYSDFAVVASPYPYFTEPSSHASGVHLVICVHGLDGNSSDLRLVRVYLQLALPDCQLEFLMSECNQQDTFAGFDIMRDNLIDEIITFIDELEEPPTRISFIGHSMGCVLVRAALVSPRFQPYVPKLHTFLSLSGPHLGTVYNSSGLVNMGMWVMQKWKKSESLAQLRLRDCPDLRNTYMYRLSASEGLDYFRYVLLVSSPQDRYVPYHSTRIELCKAAVRDSSTLGIVYMEMVTNLLQRLIKSPRTTVVRYDIHYYQGTSANNLIGRAAHIAVLDSEPFLEKFICVSAAKYFR